MKRFEGHRHFSVLRKGLLSTAGNFKTYEELQAQFRFNIPNTFNLGSLLCDDHVSAGNGHKTALIDGVSHREISFQHLKSQTNKLANALKHFGVERNSRIAIYLPQSVETVVSHLTTFKTGAISVPLFYQFGPDAIDYRLRDSESKVIITDDSGFQNLQAVFSREALPALELIVCVSNDSVPEKIGDCPVLRYDSLLENASDQFEPISESLEKESLLIYTSGTTGPPKGALHASRVLFGHLPAVELHHNIFPRPDDIMWTPADFAWIGGLLNVLLPSLYYGIPVVAYRAVKFDPDETLHLMKKHKVTSSFMPPTALKFMKPHFNSFQHQMASIGSGGETLGETLTDWAQEVFGTTINEFYGQTECNPIVSNCSTLFAPKNGSMGRAVCGKDVRILNDEGAETHEGNICVHRSDPACMLRYWNNPEATAKKFIGDYLITGDQGFIDEDGHFFFKGRDDDIICTSGYRVGPGEIEECALKHPAVNMAAAIGKPDNMRGEVVKLFCILNQGVEGNELLKAELQNFVKKYLAKHEYPRELEFVDSLPMTTTGKIQRKILKQTEIDRSKT